VFAAGFINYNLKIQKEVNKKAPGGALTSSIPAS